MKKRKVSKRKNTQIQDKKKIYKLIGIILFIVVILNIFYIKSNYLSHDEKLFKYEFERFNNKQNASKKSYINVSIKKYNGVIYLTDKKLLKMLKSGTGVIYFAYPESNYSRSSLKSLFSALRKNNINNLYYYNAYESRDEKTVSEDGSISTIRKGSKTYYKMLALLGDKADTYLGLNDASIKRLYFPTVVVVKNGKIIGYHSGTVSTNTDEFKNLTNKQSKELENIYSKEFLECDSKC